MRWRLVVGLALVVAACSELKKSDAPDASTEGDDAGVTDDAGALGDGASTDAGCTTPAPGDPENCGACGRSCGGGACEGTVCKPVVLAPNLLSPADIRTFGTYVYWVEQGTATKSGADGRLQRAPMAACTADAGCVTPLGDAGAPLSGLAVNATDVFVTQTTLSGGAVRRFPFASGAFQRFAPNEVGARRIALDSTRAIWVNAGSGAGQGAIRAAWLDGSSDGGTSIQSNLDNPAALAIHGTNVFYSVRGQLDLDGSIVRCDITGGAPLPVATSQAQPRGVAVDATWVYWVNRGDGTVHRARWDGTQAAELVTSARAPNSIAVDGDGIYWAESGTDPDLLDGRVRAADLDGKNVRTLADPVPALMGIAVDGEFVYAISRGTFDQGYRDGALLKVRKR